MTNARHSSRHSFRRFGARFRARLSVPAQAASQFGQKGQPFFRLPVRHLSESFSRQAAVLWGFNGQVLLSKRLKVFLSTIHTLHQLYTLKNLNFTYFNTNLPFKDNVFKKGV